MLVSLFALDVHFRKINQVLLLTSTINSLLDVFQLIILIQFYGRLTDYEKRKTNYITDSEIRFQSDSKNAC